jgi:hypothetical protein
LGGFSTDKELFMELVYLYNTIDGIHSKLISNKNKILLLLDPYFNSDKSEIQYGINVYNWKNEENVKAMSYKEISYEVIENKMPETLLHSNLLNKNELQSYIPQAEFTNEKDFKEIIDLLRKSVDVQLKINPNEKNSNIQFLKKQLLLTERFLSVIETYLNDLTEKSYNNPIIHQVDLLLSELNNFLDNKGVLEIIQHEYKENQVIDSLTNLLDLQIKITEKINRFNL